MRKWVALNEFWRVTPRNSGLETEEWKELEGWDLWYEITDRPHDISPYRRWCAVIA